MSIENAWRALDQVSTMIRFADAKAVAALSVSGVLGGWVLTTFPSRHLLGAELGRALLEAGSLAALAAAAGFALLAMRPRVHSTYGASLIHFEEAARLFASDADSFALSCQALFIAEDRLMASLCQQLGVNSMVAAGKFRDVNRSFAAFGLGLGLAAIATLTRIT
jgi:hypothetical protein